MKKNINGFTLIELVVVIVILGVLAVVAVPKFIDLAGDSRKAVMSSLAGSLKSAVTMIHTKALIQNKRKGPDVIDANGIFYAIENGYPSTHNSGTGSGDSSVNASGILNVVDLNGFPLMRIQQTGNGVRQAFFYYGNGTNSFCNITYNETASSDVPPQIVVYLDGC
jgi:MSHA pilin protein MshA